MKNYEKNFEFWTLESTFDSHRPNRPLEFKFQKTEPIKGESPNFTPNNHSKMTLRNLRTLINDFETQNQSLKKKSVKIFMCHLLANLLIVMKTMIQEYYDRYCWIDEVCTCNNEFIPKLYSILNEILCYWLFIVHFSAKSTLIFRNLYYDKQLTNIFYVVSMMGIIFYSVVAPEKGLQNIYMYFFVFAIILIIVFKNQKKEKYPISIFLKNVLKSHCILCFVFGNYLLMRLIFLPLKRFINDNTPESWKIFQLFLLLYFQVFMVSIKKLLFIYKKFIISQIKETMEPTLLMMRVALCHLMSISVCTLLKIGVGTQEDWSKWVTIIFHTNFVFNFYTRIDILEVLCKKLLHEKTKLYQFFKFFWSQPTDKEYRKFSRMFSGTMIDMQAICVLRLLSWKFNKRWVNKNYTSIFYANCRLEISENFQIGIMGMVAVLLINLILPVGMLAMMIVKRNIFFEYKMNKSKVLNVGILFACYVYFDAIFQTFYVY